MNEARDTRYLFPILARGRTLELSEKGVLSSDNLFVRGNSIENGLILDLGGFDRLGRGFYSFLKI